MIITKFPFPPREDPVIKALSERTENAFYHVHVPIMTFDLKQAVGAEGEKTWHKRHLVILAKCAKLLILLEARVAEVVDARDLKSLGTCSCAGSSPAPGILFLPIDKNQFLVIIWGTYF